MSLASVAEIKEAEIKLRESQNFTQKISETTPGLVTVYHLTQGEYIYVNRAIKSILGYEPAEFLAGGIAFASSLVHPEDFDIVMQNNQEAVERANAEYPSYDDNTIVEFEYRMLHKNGQYIWLHTYGVVFKRDENNLVEKILNVSVDVSKRKHTEDELKQTRRELQLLNEDLERKVKERTAQLEAEKLALRKQTERNNLIDKATNDVIWDSNLLTNTITYNENYRLLFGYNVGPEEISSDSWLERIHPDDKSRVVSGIDHLMHSKQHKWSDEYRFIRSDGTYANILDRGYIQYDEEGIPYRMVGCMTDVTRLKQAEAKAKANEIKFRRIYESNIIGMIFGNIDGNFIEANDAFLQMTGYTREDLESGQLHRNKITPPEFFEVSAKAVEQLKRQGTSSPFEKQYYHKDGRRISVLLGSAILPDLDRDMAVTYVIDITESKEAQRKIKENQDKFTFLADAIPQKIWTADPEGKINYMNKVWLDYTGKSFEDLNDNFDITHPDDREKTISVWRKAIETGESFEIEHRYRNVSGQYRWHLSRGVAQRDSNGKVIMWVGTNTDIHDQKTFAEALKISEDYFRELSDNVPFVIWKVDKNGEATYVNKSWIDFTGLSFEDSMGIGWGNAVHPEDQEKEFNNFALALNKQVPYNSKLRLKRRDGVYRYMLSQSTPLFNPDFIGYIGSLTDITEQELAQQATELLMQQKDEFMSIASHELKTPITSMKAYLQIVERISAKSESLSNIHIFIGKANKQVNKLTALVDDLLDVTKIHAGKMIFNKSSFTIREIIDECLDEMRNTNNHTIEIEGDMELVLVADKHRIEQVITNFLSNAIKYSPDADRILVSIEEEEADNVRLTVRDFGIGIPADKLHLVFDRFFRVQESSQKFSGLGLGLYISSEIIKRHGGTIGVDSTEGKGSEFWFTIPKGQEIKDTEKEKI